MSGTPRPAVIDAELEHITYEQLPRLAKLYRWAHSMRYEAVRTGGGGGGSDASDPVAQAVCQCPSGRRNVCGRCRGRALIDKAASHILDARQDLAVAIDDLEKALRAADPGPVELMSQHDKRIPRTATKAEVAEAKAAALRRAGRGEGYGAA